MIYEQFRALLKSSIRSKRFRNQSELAEAIGITQGQMSSIINGRENPSERIVKMTLDKMELPDDYLLTSYQTRKSFDSTVNEASTEYWTDPEHKKIFDAIKELKDQVLKQGKDEK